MTRLTDPGVVPPGVAAGVARAPSHAPREPRVGGRIDCRRCKVAMSRAMLAWHLRHDHAFLRCRTCQGRILRTGLVRSSMRTADFCSPACMDESLRLGLCGSCWKPPDPSFASGFCLPCRMDYRRRVAATSVHGRSTEGALYGIGRAKTLPAPYQRCDRASA